MAARRPSADGAALTPNKALSRMAATALNHFEPHVRAIAHIDSGFADGRRDVGVLRRFISQLVESRGSTLSKKVTDVAQHV